MYSKSAEQAWHSCWSSGDDTRLYPDGQLASTYSPVAASRLQLPTSTDPFPHASGIDGRPRKAHALSALHTAPCGHVAHTTVSALPFVSAA